MFKGNISVQCNLNTKISICVFLQQINYYKMIYKSYVSLEYCDKIQRGSRTISI